MAREYRGFRMVGREDLAHPTHFFTTSERDGTGRQSPPKILLQLREGTWHDGRLTGRVKLARPSGRWRHALSEESQLQIGRTDSGYLICVRGRGTCRESAAAQEFARQSFRVENCSIAIDLSECEHLDSTFLGCLVNLYKQFGIGHPSRFVVVVSPEKSLKLLVPSRLDKFLEIWGTPPELQGTLLNFTSPATDRIDLARHVMECHRILADLEVPNAAAFASVADQIERELAAEKEIPPKTAGRS